MSRDTAAKDTAPKGPQGISNRESPQEEAEERQAYPPVQETPPPPQDAGGDTSEPADLVPDEQTSIKSGARSAAQKAAGVRHPDGPMPATQKVAGAFGRERDRDEPTPSSDDENQID